MKVDASTVRHVIGKLNSEQLEKLKGYASNNKFSHSWFWHGAEGSAGMDYKDINIELGSAERVACALSAAFNVTPSAAPGNFWGAKVDENLVEAMAHLSEASGGDAGSINYILELSQLNHEQLVSIIDDSISGERNFEDFVLAKSVHQGSLNRTVSKSISIEQATTARKVFSAMTHHQLGQLLKYSLENDFNHGWFWIQPEDAAEADSEEEGSIRGGLASPLAVAFDLTPCNAAGSWRGCKLDSKFVDALSFWSKNAGGEIGMEDYEDELNALNGKELERLIRSVAVEALLN